MDASAIILGAPTVLAGAHPLAVYAAHLIKALRPPTRFAAVLSSYGWAGSAVKQIQEILETSKIEIVGAVEVNGPPRKEDILDIVDLGRQISKKIKESLSAWKRGDALTDRECCINTELRGVTVEVLIAPC
ncbi:hypothetical protein HKBW3S42_00486 [Candidatus Hakubella thermalkaliphila]|uniref:Flavodoxin-like domain-containing protein n=1 Tax=Candidatus Hakubella thermalkaliphila TaxID=2754717 RepID=A0A6V8QFE9_9ACTN|nr:hypothetical protein HKBW3S42_00486 [Candidatus Hakubella thermalkaliphila]GFP43453.1 hypothetical protein HKBW3C_02583 [Candidatus Hakubella thermalkaliphila]